MCFNYKLSLLATTLHYSAIGYILSKTKLRNDKNLLYCMLWTTTTTGLIEPIEGFIHYKYVDNMQVKIPPVYRNVLKYAILMQPLFSNVIFMMLKVNPQFNKYLFATLVLHYIIVIKCNTNSNEISVYNKEGNKLSWKWINDIPLLMVCSQIISFWMPLILSSRRQGLLRHLLINQITIFIIGLVISQNDGGRNGSLWCFFSSSALWYILNNKYLICNI